MSEWPKQMQMFLSLPNAEQAETFDTFAHKFDRYLAKLSQQMRPREYTNILKAADGDARFLSRIPLDHFNTVALRVLTGREINRIDVLFDAIHGDPRLMQGITPTLMTAAKIAFMKDDLSHYASLHAAVQNIPLLKEALKKQDDTLHTSNSDKNFELILSEEETQYDCAIRLNFTGMINPQTNQHIKFYTRVTAGPIHHNSLVSLHRHWLKSESTNGTSAWKKMTQVFKEIAQDAVYDNKTVPDWVSAAAKQEILVLGRSKVSLD